MKYLLILIIFISAFAEAQPPNNLIFNGGGADGADRASFSQASNNIFSGGNADGWAFVSFAQANTNIFNGGGSDGWSFASFAQANTNIYNGGNADGWASTSFAQAVNNIYNGGNADGWAFTNFAQASNNIFNGGEGDGWASTYRPLGPLPITLLSFEAAKQGSKVSLQWEVSSAINFSHFDIERSSNALSFMKIGVVNGTAASTYNSIDAFPTKGNNYYRLKLVDRDGKFTYTPVRVVNFGDAEDFISIYPNPVVTQTRLVLSAAMMREPIVLNVINSLGQVVIHQKIVANSLSVVQLDCSRLPAGMYVVHLKGISINVSSRIIKQ